MKTKTPQIENQTPQIEDQNSANLQKGKLCKTQQLDENHQLCEILNLQFCKLLKDNRSAKLENKTPENMKTRSPQTENQNSANHGIKNVAA